MTDSNDVKNALTALRDAAENEAGKDSPDLKVIAEAFNKFNDAWVTKRTADLEQETNPDGVVPAESRATKPTEVPSAKPAKS